MPSYPQYYRDGFDPAKHYTKRLHQENQYLFAQDLNEDLSAERNARRTLGDALFADGDVVRGGAIAINGATGAVTLEAGDVYVQGMVRSLAAATLTVPVIGEALVGVVIEERVITHLEDENLKFRNFPTLSFESHGQPRQPALQETPRWGSSHEVLTDTAEVGYRFFPVYIVRDGQLVDTAPPTEANAFTALVERYDRDRNGHYVSRGCVLTYLHKDAGAQVYSLSEGVANVDGRKIDRPTAARLTYIEDPDLERINAEPHLYEPVSGTATITLNRTPVDTIHDVSVLTEKTVTVTRGQSTGGRDPLPDSQIQSVTLIKQGATTYVVTADYRQSGDEIDWSPAGAEPAPGSTYQVTYRYKMSIAPVSQTATSVTIAGAVADSEVDIDYSWKMPRYDIVALDRENAVVRLKGVPSAYNPQVPQVPDHLLEIGRIEQRWTADYPRVADTATRAVPVRNVGLIQEAIVTLMREQARQRLASEASIRNPAATNGIFVDNFDTDAQRDAGIAQTAVIVNGLLGLPIGVEIQSLSRRLSTSAPHYTLEYTLEDAIAQPLATGAVTINAAYPSAHSWARLEVNVAVDLWAGDAQEAARLFYAPTVDAAGNLLATVAEGELRARTTSFRITGFGSGEALTGLTFGGVDITPAGLTAGSNGTINGNLTTPAGLPAGSYTVEARGGAGSVASAVCTGRESVSIDEWRRVAVADQDVALVWQSFVPTEGMHLGSVAFRVPSMAGTFPITVQLRDVARGLPGRTVLAEAIVSPGTGDIEVPFYNLPWCEAGVEKAIVWLTNEPRHTIAVAEAGKYDAQAGRWVTAQPYQIGSFGVMSGPSSWAVHEDIDACFRLRRAKFTATTHTVQLTTIRGIGGGIDFTDLLFRAGVDAPTADATVELIAEDNSGKRLFSTRPGVPISLPSPISSVSTLKAVLRGTEKASPILFTDVTVVMGKVAATGDYVSRAFTCGANRTVRVEMRALLSGTATAVPSIQKPDGAWQALTFVSHDEAGDGWRDYVYEVASFSADTTRLRIVLSGTARDRPWIEHVKVLPLAL